MKGRFLTAAVVGSVALAAASFFNLWRQMAKLAESDQAFAAAHTTALSPVDTKTSTAAASPDPVASTGKVSQLLKLEKIAPDDPVAGSKRRAILMEWFQQDFAGALAYCKALGYEDLKDADVARFVAKSASVEQLADIIGTSPTPFEVTRNLCAGAGLEKVQELMKTADHYTGEAGKGFAGGVSVYLAEKNIDAAIMFAGSRANEDQRSSAVASVVDQLASEGKNSEVQFLYEALDEKLRATDPVKFAYGQSLHDADPETALGLLYSIKDPALKQVAVLSFARKMEATQPNVAVDAVLSAGLSESARTQQVERIVSDWLLLDRESASAYLASTTSLAPELRAKLQAKVK